MKREDTDLERDELLTPSEWAEVEHALDEVETGRSSLRPWHEFVSRIRMQKGWSGSRSDRGPDAN